MASGIDHVNTNVEAGDRPNVEAGVEYLVEVVKGNKSTVYVTKQLEAGMRVLETLEFTQDHVKDGDRPNVEAGNDVEYLVEVVKGNKRTVYVTKQPEAGMCVLETFD